MLDSLLALDTKLLYLINVQGHSEYLNGLMRLCSSLGFLLTVALLGLGIYIYRKGLVASAPVLTRCLIIVIAILVVDNSTKISKHMVDRTRPSSFMPGIYRYDYHQGKDQWVQRPWDYTGGRKGGESFYSAHAANAATLAFLAARVFPVLSPAIYVIPAVSGYSRIYLGKHYPTDILSGWLFGWLFGILFFRLENMIFVRLNPLVLAAMRKSAALTGYFSQK